MKGDVPEWVAEMTCRFWRGVFVLCCVGCCCALLRRGEYVLVVVVAYTHTLWRRRRHDSVVGLGWRC
jgi:hypothetical protein